MIFLNIKNKTVLYIKLGKENEIKFKFNVLLSRFLTIKKQFFL